MLDKRLPEQWVINPAQPASCWGGLNLPIISLTVIPPQLSPHLCTSWQVRKNGNTWISKTGWVQRMRMLTLLGTNIFGSALWMNDCHRYAEEAFLMGAESTARSGLWISNFFCQDIVFNRQINGLKWRLKTWQSSASTLITRESRLRPFGAYPWNVMVQVCARAAT